MMAAQDGCHSLGKVLELHFPLVQPKGKTQGPGCQVGQSRPGALSYGSVAAGEGVIPISWARHHFLISSLCSSQRLSCWLKGWLQGFPVGQLGAGVWEYPIVSPRKAKQCHELEGPGMRSCSSLWPWSIVQACNGTPTLQGAHWYHCLVGPLVGFFLHGKWTKLDISKLI